MQMLKTGGHSAAGYLPKDLGASVPADKRNEIEWARNSTDLLDAMDPADLQAMRSLLTNSKMEGVPSRQRLADCLKEHPVDITGPALGQYHSQILHVTQGSQGLQAELRDDPHGPGTPLKVLDQFTDAKETSLSFCWPNGSLGILNQHKDRHVNLEVWDSDRQTELTTSFIGNRTASASARVAGPSGELGMCLFDDGIGAVMNVFESKPGTEPKLTHFVSPNTKSRVWATETAIRAESYELKADGCRSPEHEGGRVDRWTLFEGMNTLNQSLLDSYPNLAQRG